MTWDDLTQHKLTIYSTSWCSDCHRLKKILAGHGLAWQERDIDADPAAAEELARKTGRTSIPWVEIDGCGPIPGWHEAHPGRWDEARFLAAAAKALE